MTAHSGGFTICTNLTRSHHTKHIITAINNYQQLLPCTCLATANCATIMTRLKVHLLHCHMVQIKRYETCGTIYLTNNVTYTQGTEIGASVYLSLLTNRHTSAVNKNTKYWILYTALRTHKNKQILSC